MALPWMSVANARVELESVSSSLLHSIYGSQVSQVLLASDDSTASILSEGPRAQERQGRRCSVRPKSSPAVTRSEREKKQPLNIQLQPTSASNSAHRLTRQLQRPATSCVRARPGSCRGRNARPLSALEVCRVSSPLFLDDVEEEEVETPRASIQHTKPVVLTRTPEYLNFWQGKPLSKREYSVPVHARTAWKRPKSDYGSRIIASKGGGNTGLSTVSEVEDGLLGPWRSGVHVDKTFSKGSNLLSGTNRQGSRSDKRSNGSQWSDAGKEIGQNSRVGNRSGTGTAAASVWAQRSQRRKTHDGAKTSISSSDDDDFFHKNVAMHSSWLQVGGRNTKRTRFELPMDLTLLEQMSPLQYLRTHCIVSNYHMAMCSRAFTRFDKDRDAHLSKQEVMVALPAALHDCLALAQARQLLTLVLYQQHTMADLHLFAALCCLAERVFSIHLRPAMAGKDLIECVDFEALEWKLRGCTVEPSLYKLFTLL